MEKLIVTRHKALVQVLQEDFGIEGEVVEHATAEMLDGRDVVGILPIYLAARTNTVTVLELAVPPEMRGVELTVEDVRKFMGKPKTYRVEELQ
jgi:hypothetical protein